MIQCNTYQINSFRLTRLPLTTKVFTSDDKGGYSGFKYGFGFLLYSYQKITLNLFVTVAGQRWTFTKLPPFSVCLRPSKHTPLPREG